MHKLKEKLNEELHMYEEKTMKNPNIKISDAELNRMHLVSGTLKNLMKIKKYEDEGYSEDGYYMGEGRVYGTSYAGRKRDSMGRYSRDDGRKHGGYRYKDKEEMLQELNEMLEEAGGTKEREAIKQCIRELEE